MKPNALAMRLNVGLETGNGVIISVMRTPVPTPGEASSLTLSLPRRDDRDGCDGFFESGGGV
jgi:hypothetical protein